MNDGNIFEAEETISDAGLKNSSAKLFPSGTVCIALYGATVGRVGILCIDAATNQAVCGIRTNGCIRNKYLFHFLRSQRANFIRQGQGGAQPNISQGIVRATNLPIAPLPEQDRIVEEIEKQFSRLDAVTAALKRVQANLKRYRASVLKAACEGRLVPTEAELARKESRDYEPADKLLQRVLRERRARWEADTLARMFASGKPPKDDSWKRKYKEPSSPDTSNLPTLPEGWCWASIDQLSTSVRNGISVKPDHESGLRILRISSVRAMQVDLADVRYLLDRSEWSTYLLNEGDLLFIRYNGNREFVGVCGRVGLPMEKLVHPDKLIRVVPHSDEIARYIEVMANVGVSRGFVDRKIRTTAGQSGVSGEDVKNIPIPLCPLPEQIRIYEEVQQRISAGTSTQASLAQASARSSALRQSTLSAAFSGRLVAQDPSDEPASVLIGRIRVERSTSAQPKPRKAIRRARRELAHA